jgi:hypothetical protein
MGLVTRGIEFLLHFRYRNLHPPYTTRRLPLRKFQSNSGRIIKVEESVKYAIVFPLAFGVLMLNHWHSPISWQSVLVFPANVLQKRSNYVCRSALFSSLNKVWQRGCIWFSSLPILHYSRVVGVCFLLVVMTACTLPQSATPEIQLSMQVEPSGRPGIYTITGNTNLPDQSRITVSGIRYLRSSTEPVDLNNQEIPYSILARQTVEVAQGKWQTTLNLWQVAPDGRYQESWQLNESKLRQALTPNATVTFVAVLEPVGQPATLYQQLENNQKIQGDLVRFTPDGQQYLQVSQTLPVDLPKGKTAASGLTTQDLNHGWGDRNQLKSAKPDLQTS